MPKAAHDRDALLTEIKESCDEQGVINSLLRLSLQDILLDELLQHTLDLLTDVSWIALQSKGAIFLVEDQPEVLVMKAQKGLTGPIGAACAKVPFGYCLCGRAAATREIQFADCVDERHDIHFEGMAPHGHFCIPIRFGERLLGVITLYIDAGHRRSAEEEEFLTAIANTLAGIIMRREAEEARHRSQEQFRLLLSNVPAVVFKGYLDGAIDLFDDKVEELTGYPKEEFESRRLKWTDLILEEDRHHARQLFIRALKTSRAYVREYRIGSKVGNIIWVQERSRLVGDAEGRVAYVSGLFFDITERKELEATVAERDAQLQKANENLRLWGKDLEQRNHEINLLGQMGGLLEGCNTSAEAYPVIRHSLMQLFPNDSGAIYMFDASRQQVEAATVWGDAPSLENSFAPEDCWALRRGRPHSLAEIHAGCKCRHVAAETTEYLCMPLMAHAEGIGVIHILLGSPDQVQAETKQNLALKVAELLGLALAKLRLQETLRHLSARDPLTGLFNRRYMEESLEREMQRAGRKGTQVGVIMVDIDHFKHFNDTFGHDGGDALLRRLGEYLQQRIRGGDIACRYGGEEFVLVLQDVSLEATLQRAEQVREDVKHLQVYQGGRVLDSITLSLGVAISPDQGDTPREVLQAADLALYRAKETGRDRTCVAGKV